MARTLMDMLAPLTAATALSTWIVEPAGTTIAVLAGVAYLAGLRIVHRRGTRWPVGRTVWFFCGVVLLVIATNSAIGAYSHALFWMHMVQHLLLITVVPALLVMGHPISLLAACGPAGQRAVQALRRNWLPSLVSNPVVALALYTAVLVGTHLTTYMQLMPTHMWMHSLEVVLYVGSGYLFLLTLLVHEPIRWNPPYPARLGLLFVSMIIDAGVGVTLMMAEVDPFPGFAAMRDGWGPSGLDDIHIGGAVMWVGGDGLMMLAIIALAARWIVDTERQNDMGAILEAVRRNAMAAVADEPGATSSTLDTGGTDVADSAGVSDADAIRNSTNLDDDERAYLAYNRLLARLAESEKRHETR